MEYRPRSKMINFDDTVINDEKSEINRLLSLRADRKDELRQWLKAVNTEIAARKARIRRLLARVSYD